MQRFHKYTIENNSNWDLIIIGGGATGLGTALDSASRGFKTILVEQSDFAKGTSSRSTKLVHGGVRYLAQGNVGLVKHALKERGLLEKNAGHLVTREEFIIPCYDWLSVVKYLTGLTLYDLLARNLSFGASRYLSKGETLKMIPGIKSEGLKGSISYFDGKFDDARLAINIAQTAVENGATLINYMKVIGLLKNETAITGVEVQDSLTGEKFNLNGKVVVNATGIFVDEILKMSNPAAKKLVRPSQGIHIVLRKSFLKSKVALMIPKTPDGRVLFAVPWHDHLLIGTTDTPLDEHSLEPRALKEEIDFILTTAGNYFTKKPKEKDILSVFSGLRPLAAPTASNNNNTKEISRDHKLMVSAKGLITITGGKWTTYRKMAQDTVNLAIKHGGLTKKKCVTEELSIHGNKKIVENHYLNIYGSDKSEIQLLCKKHPEFAEKLHPNFPNVVAEVIWAARYEMAETVEDVLGRRLRILFIDAHVAIEMTPKVAQILAKEFGADQKWIENQTKTFIALAEEYLVKIP